MISLFAVVSPTRSGTRWYSKLFTHDDVHCFHELSILLEPIPANTVLNAALAKAMSDHDFDQRQRRYLLDGYPQYFSRLLEREHFGQRHSGNSDSRLLRTAAGVWLLWPETKFLFSVRNGINQVNSTFTSEPGRSVFERTMRQQRARLRGLSDFEVSCHRWTEMVERWAARRRWLAERGAHCLSTTLERMTEDEQELERVWTWLVGGWDRHAERAVSMMRRPVNQRVNLDGAVHSAEEIWARWDDLQRAAFIRICGTAQLGLDYEIPGS